jgi:hypothetical protein
MLAITIFRATARTCARSVARSANGKDDLRERRTRILDRERGTWRQKNLFDLLLTSAPDQLHPVKPRAVGTPGSAGSRA